MSMFADNPRDQEDWTVHVSSNRKDGDSKRPLYGESPETGSKSGGSEKKQLSGGANESREEETTDERGWFARCCSWIYRCLRGCVRIAGKRKGSTLTLSTVVGVCLARRPVHHPQETVYALQLSLMRSLCR
eukprot:gb/GECG01012880.1/.p1 GENE.gb/GECG01012880.1/~~gb/GECG01012880.1/.p1  ORF type:complete len:131 (+),score=10.22 gb/GECG01012880.1/:1-393(+)